MMKTNDLIDEITDRPVRERAEIAEAILATLHQPDSNIEQAWLEEVDRRAEEVERGDVEMLSQQQFEQRRAKRNRS